jgi:hypothetical protein
MPHVRLQGDPCDPLSPDDSAQLDTLMRDAASQEVRVGR